MPILNFSTNAVVGQWPTSDDARLSCHYGQPSLQLDDDRSAALIARANAQLRRHAVDLALDGEQNIDALDCLGRDRRLVDAR
jgi:hypothetical protein